MSVTVDRTAQRFTSGAQPEADVCCLHTTEVWGWPGYAGGGQAPHATIKPIAGKGLEVREHIPTTQYAKALMNLPGGVETNRRGVLQYEMMGTCDPRRKNDMYFWPDADDVVLSALAGYLRPILATYKIPLVSPPFKAYPASYGSNGVRFTNAQWNSFNGICGHEHVPENVHGDPGAFPIGRLISFLNNTATPGGFLMSLSETEERDLYNRVMGGIPAGDVRGVKNPDGSPARVLTSADGNYLVSKIAASGTTPAEIAAAIPDNIAQQVIDALGAKLTTPKEN